MKLAYQAVDHRGRLIRQTIEAASAAEATERLRHDGLFVTDIDEAAAGAELPTLNRFRGRIGPIRRLRLLSSFCRQLYVLTTTGTPILAALQALERQTSDAKWRAVLGEVRADVEEGRSLSEALREHPRHFDPVFTSVIAAGESSGHLDEMLSRLAALAQKQLHLRRSVVGALIYPAVLMSVGVVVLIVLLTFVLPRFAGMFETLDAAIPPSTQFMMFISHILTHYWWAVLVGTAATGAGVWRALKTERGRRLAADALLKLPRFGKMAKDLITARVMRLLGTLLNANVTVLDALALTRDAAGHPRYAELIAEAEDAVTHGDPMSAAFEHSELLDPAICEAIRNGEKSGQVGPLLLNIADFMDEENDVLVRSLSALIEPVILLFLGLIVGVVAVSMFLPLFDLTSMGGAL
jgi:type II secretory pathway component PulF